MFILRNIDSKTLAALLLCAARTYRTQSLSKENPQDETAVSDGVEPCRKTHCALGRDEIGRPRALH